MFQPSYDRLWRTELQLDKHYKPHVVSSEVDPQLRIDPVILEALVKQFGCRRIAVELTKMKCYLCGKRTRGFSYLACARLCSGCLSTTDCGVCTVAQAKASHVMRYQLQT
jgi:hypothetical protein